MEGARVAGADDVPAVASLARQAIAELAELRGGGVWRLREARQEPLEPALAAAIDGPADRGTAVVGTVDDVVVGYATTTIEVLADGSRLAVVGDLYVDPVARGIGIGEAMMDLLVANAELAGATGIDAMALPGDRATKNFFETFGLKARAIVVHRDLAGPGAAS